MKHFLLTGLVLIGILLSDFAAKAQNNYSFETAQQPYVELTNATQIPFSDFDPQTALYKVDAVTGQTWYFYKNPFLFNTNFKTMHIQSNGVVRIDNDSTLIIIDAAFTFLDSIDLNSAVSYKFEVLGNETIFKSQFKNLKIRVGQANNYLNLQIWIYKNTGLIELRYGPSSSSNGSGFNTSSGPQVGMFYSRDNFSACYEKLWVNGSPSGFSLDSNKNYVFQAMSGIPAEGVVFRFKPRFVILGLEDILNPKNEKATFTVFPNPAKSSICFDKKGDYQISDLSGKVIMNIHATDSVDIQNLRSGIYLIQNQSGSIQRFVKE